MRLPVEEHAVIFSPPRTGKTGWLSSVILHYPGPVLSAPRPGPTCTRTPPAPAARLGRVDIFNPQGIGRVPRTMTWDPISGCLDIATAIRRADAFALAVSSQGVEDGAFWAAKTSDYLRAFMYAAAYARTRGVAYGLATAARWALSGASREAEDILTDAGALDWSAQVQELRGEAQKTAADNPHVHDAGARRSCLTRRWPGRYRRAKTTPGLTWSRSSGSRTRST